MTRNKISVIIPTFNRRDLLDATLQSILRQTSSDWEAIVVDDGSTDGSWELLGELSRQDDRIRPISRYRGPKGAATCRNIGLLNASYKYVIFLDSDDLMEPHCIENRLNAAKEFPKKDYLVFQIASFSSSSAKPECIWNIEKNEDDFSRFIKLDAVWQTSSVLWKKDKVRIIGGFDEKLHCWQDVDIHLRALIAGLSYQKFLDSQPDILYRRHTQNSISQKEINSFNKLQSRKVILARAYFMTDERPKMRRELRWMASNIIASAANGHHFRFAYNLLFSSWLRNIFQNRETTDILKLLLVNHLRLEHLSKGKKMKRRIMERILWKNTICQIPVAQNQ